MRLRKQALGDRNIIGARVEMARKNQGMFKISSAKYQLIFCSKGLFPLKIKRGLLFRAAMGLCGLIFSRTV